MEVNVPVVVAVCEVTAGGGAWAGSETGAPGAAHNGNKTQTKVEKIGRVMYGTHMYTYTCMLDCTNMLE